VGVSTGSTQLWGFGLENIADRATRATVIREGLGTLGLDPYTQTTGGATGTVPATLGAGASFGGFTPGVAKTYTASTTATVISSAGDAALTVADPSTDHTGHLVNGSFFLPQPLGGLGTIKTYASPVSNDVVAVTFTQPIAQTDALRTGAYSKTLTFTLSTTNP
jgi:hypothetical protein